LAVTARIAGTLLERTVACIPPWANVSTERRFTTFLGTNSMTGSIKLTLPARPTLLNFSKFLDVLV
jgi:hypothetical protein